MIPFQASFTYFIIDTLVCFVGRLLEAREALLQIHAAGFIHQSVELQHIVFLDRLDTFVSLKCFETCGKEAVNDIWSLEHKFRARSE